MSDDAGTVLAAMVIALCRASASAWAEERYEDAHRLAAGAQRVIGAGEFIDEGADR